MLNFFLLACCIASSYSGSYTIFLQFICGGFLFFLVHKPYLLSHMIHSFSFPTVFLFACQVLSLIFPWCGTFCRKVPRTTSFPNYNFLKAQKNLTSVCGNKLPSLASFYKSHSAAHLTVMILRPGEDISSITCCSLNKFFAIFL